MKIIYLAAAYWFSMLFGAKAQLFENRSLTNLTAKNSIHQFTLKDIDGKEFKLAELKGKVLVVINVASECGNTPQYTAIQKFYETYKDKGVVVLGLPANNFGGQEPGDEKQIKEFCTSKYAVTFPMFAKVSARGDDQSPLYQFLTQKEKNGVADSQVRWNFQKYILDKNGFVAGCFNPKTSVNDESFLAAITTLLK
jgi:glutathione peroxidase